MKKKMLLWTLIVLTVLLMASTAFAANPVRYDYRILRYITCSSGLQIGTYAYNQNQETWISGMGYGRHQCWLTNTSHIKVGPKYLCYDSQTISLAPGVAGFYYLRLYNYDNYNLNYMIVKGYYRDSL